MGSYIKSTLISGEKVIYEARISWLSQMPTIVVGLLTLPLWGIGFLFLLAAYIRYKTTELAFTNKRVIAKFGFISRKTVELTLVKVESVQVNQGIVGRILNYGTLVFSGAGNPQAPIPGISDPMSFRRSFMEFQDKKAAA